MIVCGSHLLLIVDEYLFITSLSLSNPTLSFSSTILKKKEKTSLFFPCSRGLTSGRRGVISFLWVFLVDGVLLGIRLNGLDVHFVEVLEVFADGLEFFFFDPNEL